MEEGPLDGGEAKLPSRKSDTLNFPFLVKGEAESLVRTVSFN